MAKVAGRHRGSLLPKSSFWDDESPQQESEGLTVHAAELARFGLGVGRNPLMGGLRTRYYATPPAYRRRSGSDGVSQPCSRATNRRPDVVEQTNALLGGVTSNQRWRFGMSPRHRVQYDVGHNADGRGATAARDAQTTQQEAESATASGPV